MKRAARLQSAVSWLKQFGGKNVVRGYCRHYGVGWRCAAIELKQLGVRIDPKYLIQREITEQQLALSRQRQRKAREATVGDKSLNRWYDYETPLAAYLAEDYAALYDMECRAASPTVPDADAAGRTESD